MLSQKLSRGGTVPGCSLRHSKPLLAHRHSIGANRAQTTRLHRSAASADQDASAQDGVKLIMYTKAGCPLCDGLQEKVTGLLQRAQFMPCALTGAELEVRDIASNAAWQAAYDMEVPVLAALTLEGQEVILPRAPPRTSADRLQKHIETALEAAGALPSED